MRSTGHRRMTGALGVVGVGVLVVLVLLGLYVVFSNL
jgi:hypothetical protein